MFFTIEPMVNAGRPEVKVLDDGWTAVTRDRCLSAQFEHMVGRDRGRLRDLHAFARRVRQAALRRGLSKVGALPQNPAKGKPLGTHPLKGYGIHTICLCNR